MFRFFLLTLKNLMRNPVRTALTTLAVVALVAIFSIILNVVRFFDDFMAEKNKDVKIMVSERYRLMSLFDRSYLDQMTQRGSQLNQELRKVPGFDSEKYTIWH